MRTGVSITCALKFSNDDTTNAADLTISTEAEINVARKSNIFLTNIFLTVTITHNHSTLISCIFLKSIPNELFQLLVARVSTSLVALDASCVRKATTTCIEQTATASFLAVDNVMQDKNRTITVTIVKAVWLE